MCTLAFSFLDRAAFGVVLDNIKGDLGLSDTQMGIMGGIAFALFYSTMGIPIAQWADSGNRVRIIGLTTALWSVTVALCGLTRNFAQLLLVRVAVGVGEAGCVPAANSLLADYFKRAERPRAAAIYWMGTPLGFGAGYVLAGWLNKFYGWRLTFMLLGLPGLILALVSWMTLREPRVAKFEEQATSAADQIQPDPQSLASVLVTLWGNATFRNLLLCLSVMYFFSYGILQWQPAFLMRSYGLSTGQVGSWFAAIYGLGGLVGTYWGGEWAARHASLNERGQLLACVTIYAALSLVSLFNFLPLGLIVNIGSLAIVGVAQQMISGPFLGIVQTLVPERMRAISIALMFLCANLIGMGGGPLAVGALSDALRPSLGQGSLRYALLATCPGYLWVAWHFWRASQTVTRDLSADHGLSRAEI